MIRNRNAYVFPLRNLNIKPEFCISRIQITHGKLYNIIICIRTLIIDLINRSSTFHLQQLCEPFICLTYDQLLSKMAWHMSFCFHIII